MEFTFNYLKIFNESNYSSSYKDKTLFNIIYLYHWGLISLKSFSDLSFSIIKNKTPEYRNTFHFKETNVWFNDMWTHDIYFKLCVDNKYHNDRYGDISMVNMIKYVSIITGQPRNLVVNTIFDLFIKPIILYWIAIQLDEKQMNDMFKHHLNVNLGLESEGDFHITYEGDYDEPSYTLYNKDKVSKILKTKLHKIARQYFKGQYHLNPFYTKTEDLDWVLNEKHHIFDILVPWGSNGINELSDTKHR